MAVQQARGERVGEDAVQFGKALALLVEYFQMKDDFMDARRVRVYEHGLRGIAGVLVMRAALYATETRTFFPKVNELKADAATVQRQLLAKHQYDPSECETCNGTGWDERERDGVVRAQRCVCWKAHQQTLANLGINQPIALPSLPPAEG